jgi:surface antigen
MKPMDTVTLKTDKTCEICGGTIAAGEQAQVRYDYDWDNPNEDIQGSIAIPFYRHADAKTCREWREVAQLKAKIDAQNDDDQFRKAIY